MNLRPLFTLATLFLLPACASSHPHAARTSTSSRFTAGDLVTIDLAPIDASPGLERLTARIDSIDRSGRLHLAAKQTIIANEHSRITDLTGDCDPSDVSNNNTINSSRLAHLRIVTTQERP